MIRPPIFTRAAAALAALAAPFVLAACTVTVSSGGECSYNGKTYAIGDTFKDDCNSCQCQEDGTVGCTLMACGCEYDGEFYGTGESFSASDGCNSCSCEPGGTVACTLVDCADTCEYAGTTYVVGDTFPSTDGCNSCSCELGGVACTELACVASCAYQGQVHFVGETFPAGDGCNSCTCTGNEQVACTDIACAPVCTYAGKDYTPGEQFPALDGCNTCTCTATGEIGCTKIACACDPAAEWWRDYVSTDPAQCQVIDYACPPNTIGFQNSCGCGCQQDLACPEFFDCMPPAGCDVQQIMETCPYSGIAF